MAIVILDLTCIRTNLIILVQVAIGNVDLWWEASNGGILHKLRTEEMICTVDIVIEIFKKNGISYSAAWP